MKPIIIFLILVLSVFTCKSQSPIVAIDTYRQDTSEGAYFKDLNNELNKFVGTWQYTNGSTTLTIVIEKKLMYFDGEYYEDLLIGEYLYIENGIEQINSLSRLNSPLITGGNHSISGRQMLNSDYYNPPCDDCSLSERRVKLHLSDPDRTYLPTSSITLRFLLNENPEKISVFIKGESGGVIPEGVPDQGRFPLGELVLTKQ